MRRSARENRGQNPTIAVCFSPPKKLKYFQSCKAVPVSALMDGIFCRFLLFVMEQFFCQVTLFADGIRAHLDKKGYFLKHPILSKSHFNSYPSHTYCLPSYPNFLTITQLSHVLSSFPLLLSESLN